MEYLSLQLDQIFSWNSFHAKSVRRPFAGSKPQRQTRAESRRSRHPESRYCRRCQTLQ
jgi:hypothetical protein